MRVAARQRGSLDATNKQLEQMRQALSKAAKYEVAVGYPAGVDGLGTPEAAYDGQASIIEVALANNYGIGVPERPFMDLAARLMQKTYRDIMAEAGPQLIKGTAKVEKVLDVAGLQAEEDVRKAIREGGWQPNSPATIARKKSSKPLIDTATMVNRVTHKVRPK